MRRLRVAALSAAAALFGAALVTVGIGATRAAASVPTTTLTLELRPTSETALHALAVSHGLSRIERARRVAALVPDSRRHHDVAGAAQALGLTVTQTTAWSMRVEAPSQTVAALFGTLSPQTSDVAGRAYPAVPAGLAPYVVAALPVTGRVARPLVSLSPRDGVDFRTAYSAPAGSTGAGLAVATVQLSGWNSSDLQKYANHHHISFDAATQYRAVSVGGASTWRPDGDGGDEEVALDQEAVLATAPGATQVAYFARNDDGGDGYVQAIHQVGADAAANHTAALSLSWGGCEASDDHQWVAAMDQALQFTLAAGVTIFAASGDQGSLDCFGEVFGPAEEAPAVDYPASSPYVVGVGGTSLPPPGSSETAVGWDGSGGGESTFEALPSWQLSVAAHSKTNHRLVPDIASDADPSNGLCIYESTTPETSDRACPAGEFMLGGTSLASPTQAALLVDTLSSLGWQTGIGDIHPALYAGAPSGALADITSDEDPDGNGTYHSVKGYDLVTGLGTPVWTSLQSWLGQFDMGAPRATRSLTFAINPHAPSGYAPGYATWSAPVGWDGTSQADCMPGDGASAPTSVTIPAGTPDGLYRFSVAGVANAGVSGATATCHVGFAAVALDRQAPTATASLRVASSGQATARWSFADAAPSSGLRKFVIVATAGTKTLWRWTTTSRSRTFTALANSRLHITVTAYDNAGNTVTVKAHLLDDGAAFSVGTRWKHVSARSAYRRSYLRTNAVGTTAKLTATAKTFTVYVTKCSSCGRIGVYDTHGHRLATVDTYSSSTRYRVPVTIRSLAKATKLTLVLHVLSAKNRHSHGRYVGLDALALT